MYMGKHLPYILVGAGIQKIHVDVDMITKQLIQEVAQMTEHKRLTTKEKYPHGAEGVSKDKLTGKYCRGVFEATACVEKLAEYENAEEEGRLVVLPSNQVWESQGDIVYYIYDYEITECVNCGISICADGKAWIGLAADEDNFPYREPIAEFDTDPTDWCKKTTDVLALEWGKTVFLTRGEAEKALKEMEGK